jgi:3-dehydroquinate synthase
MSQTSTVTVGLGARSYDIHVGTGLLAQAGALIAPLLARPRTVIVTDETVAALHVPALQASLDRAGIASDTITLPPGEGSKSFAQLAALCDGLLAHGVERKDVVIALGGGVIGDLTGFAASILKRGCRFVQIPTTLLAQVDSSVGGKTGINTAAGKNLIGSFHQPILVLADTGVLATLPPRQLRAGYAEVVKYGLINDTDFFSWCEANGAAVLAGDSAALRYAVAYSCKAKADIVAADERETQDVRALLNLGHTFGHAYEAEAGYSEALLHGEAVAIGMADAFRYSAHIGLCPAADAARVIAHLNAVGLPTRNPLPATAEVLAQHMVHDKKAEAGQLTFILTRGIGRSFVQKGVRLDDVARYLHQEAA